MSKMTRCEKRCGKSLSPFSEEVLRSNSSVMDFLHSDYVVVNERLAQHYGVPGVFGPHFRKVPVSAANSARWSLDFRRPVDDEFRRHRFSSVEARRLVA